MYNTTGSRVYANIASGNYFEVDVSAWSKGVYVMKTKVKEETFVCKIVVD
ncbi:T9SS type A sorting domain-containing protein [uncultured Draconibacterium sp.]